MFGHLREVSGRAVRSVLEVLEDARIPLEPLVREARMPLEALRGPSRIDWDAFATLIEAVDATCRDRLTLDDIGMRLLRVPSLQFLRLAARLVVSPRQLYVIANRMVAPAMFSNVTVSQAWLPSGRLAMTGTLADGYRPSEAVFRLCHANVIALPRLLDLPAAVVEEEVVTGRRGRLVLRLPASHTIAARVRRGGRAVVGLGAALRGIARQQAELEESIAALRASRHEQRELLERLPEGVLIHRHGNVVWANAALLAALGLERLDQLVGRHLLELVPPEDRAGIRAAMAAARPNQVPAERLEYRVQRADGTVCRLEAGTTQPVDFEGARARLVVLRDVTEQHRLRDQLALAERMALLGRLSAGVAHEINNPLAYAHASIEVAARELEKLEEPVRTRLEEALGRAREGAERVRGIVRDLRTLSRAEDGPTEAVDLPALLDSTIALAANAIAAKARLVRRYDDVPPARAARGRLGQLFLNLLLNAADAIPDGAADHHAIRVATSCDARGRAIVEISDTGVGIPPEHAGRVFEPFFTTKPAGAGTGLGLAICHRIVTQLGGEITLASSSGAGTTFRVALLAASDAPGVTAPDAPGAAATGPARARVLVVDDEPALLRAIGTLIGETHDVVTASSGREALELLGADGSFDVIVADLMMRGIGGIELFEAATSARPELARRFVFMTGGAFVARDRAVLATLPNPCIEKPFESAELLRAIDELLARA